MGEYGRVVGETSGATGGGGGGSRDFGGDIMSAVSDAVDQVIALPPEMLLLAIAIIVVGGLFITFRPT